MYIFGINGAHLLITCFKVSEQNLDGVNNLRVILRLFCQIHFKISIPFALKNSIIRLVMHISTPY